MSVHSIAKTALVVVMGDIGLIVSTSHLNTGIQTTDNVLCSSEASTSKYE